MRNSIKNIHFKLFLLLSVCAYSHASRPGPSEKWASSSSQAHITQELDPDALTHLIDKDNSGIPIELWEEIILPYVGIDGGLEKIYQSEHIPFTEFKGHLQWVQSAECNHDGKVVVTASCDGTARTWNALTGEQIGVFPGHTQWVNKAQFNHNGTRIITTGMQNAAWIWDTQTAQPTQRLIGHTGELLSARFNHDGTRAVTASQDKTARVWDTETGETLFILPGHPHGATSAEFSHDSRHILTASDNELRVWNGENGSLLSKFYNCKTPGRTGQINAIQLSNDGAKLIIASADGTVRIFDIATKKLIHILPNDHPDHCPPVNSACFNQHNRQVVMVSSLMTASVWDVHAKKKFNIFNDEKHLINSAHFNHDGSEIITASDDKTARLWHMPNLKPTLNQMILLWALDEQKNRLKDASAKPLTFALLAQRYNLPQPILNKVFATFSKHDQTNIQKTFNLDLAQKNEK